MGVASTSERVTLPIGPKSLAVGRTRSPSPVHSETSQRSKKSRRQGSLFEVPLLQNAEANRSTSSLSSLSSTASLPESRSFVANRRRNVDVPTPLKLTAFAYEGDTTFPQPDTKAARMGMAPDALIRAHRRARSSSAASTAISTPLTPSFRLRAAANPSHRREVLHKLERTLGEPVPPSLVFPEDTLRRAAAAAASSSDSSLSSSATVSRPSSPDIQLRSPSLDLPRETRYIAGPVRRASSTLAASSGTRASRRRSTSVHGLQLPKARNPRGSSHWQAPDEWEMGPALSSVEKQPKGMEEGECGDEYLGIWNAENYESVMTRLRSLRA